MKLLTTIITACSVFTTNHFVFSQSTNEAKAKEIIVKAVDAMGGKDLLSSIKTLYSKSSTVMDGRNVNYITKEMTPNMGSFEIEYQGRIVYRSWFDGKTGYETVNGEKKIADQEEFKDKLDRKYIMNELAYLDPSLYKVEFVETDKENKLHKIKATAKDGNITNLYYNAESYLLNKEIHENPTKGSFSTTLCTEYKKFGDLTYCSKNTFRSENGDQVATIVDLYYNKDIKKSDFKF
ncbi:MAG: hypothetical protein K0R77_1644 [Chryseobacterium sp.]|jgi:hypothetical protein|uniref:hypothetical protein n=1 Tax=Chryseobacterium sp. TaxID=1871047 RepID=UPI00260EB499|nr:hypothetical protein [Chryseobacterium sp.]MDF2552369.1 hypothetical protein [Chryseobacterium sp.]